ncbi:GntR family transcriptional regulator [Alicyclobacillus sp. ALC3]|uniref:GntR family transcriptional regulator n=1 Tax=Alicyclobacillus sp. ALC3 TaxID=2796143 RepID=UPI0023798683|nr:GntR family transcriptional regulator [Alicyclobacillus sp. ALC3]WDL98428.1 GntR family transcriptional regulator [Alicyclobacillus sp. ALC3]
MSQQDNVSIEYATLSQSVQWTIRDMIINGAVAPGERINEAHLAKKLGVSRGPIREALSRLQAEGVVTYRANRGMTVSTLSAQDAYEVYTLRGMLEEEAVLIAWPNLTEEDLSDFAKLVDEFKDAAVQKSHRRIVECDTEFHNAVVAASGHSRLLEAHRRLDTVNEVMFTTVSRHIPARIDRVVEIHELLLEALRGGDPKYAARAFRQHYQGALDQLWEHLDK